MTGRWWSTARRALAGRASAVVAVVALTMVRLLTDLGMGSAAATNAYLLALSALGLVWCGRRLAGAVSAEWPQNPRPLRSQPERPPRLVSLEETVEWAARSEHVRDTRLRPDLRFAVADRLGRGGYYLGSHPAAVPLLGPVTSAVISAVTVAEAGTGRRGLDQHQLEAIATELAGLDERIEHHHDLQQDNPADGPYETRDAH
jgi:hypothetical protein